MKELRILLTVNRGAVVDLMLALTDLLLNVEEQLALAEGLVDGLLASRGWHASVVGAAVGPVLRRVEHRAPVIHILHTVYLR